MTTRRAPALRSLMLMLSRRACHPQLQQRRLLHHALAAAVA
jgi:hypothetical protein